MQHQKSVLFLAMADHPSGVEPAPTVTEVDSVGHKRKGHRSNDEIWEYYTKIPLSKDKAESLHRNYDGCCRSCGNTVVGKPKRLKDHIATCEAAPVHTHLHSFKRLAETPKPSASGSSSRARLDAPLAK